MAEMIAGIVMETLRHYVLARVQAAGTADTPHGRAAARIGDMNARGVPTFVEKQCGMVRAMQLPRVTRVVPWLSHGM